MIPWPKTNARTDDVMIQTDMNVIPLAGRPLSLLDAVGNALERRDSRTSYPKV